MIDVFDLSRFEASPTRTRPIATRLIVKAKKQLATPCLWTLISPRRAGADGVGVRMEPSRPSASAPGMLTQQLVYQ
jgi:hypothetical protein